MHDRHTPQVTGFTCVYNELRVMRLDPSLLCIVQVEGRKSHSLRLARRLLVANIHSSYTLLESHALAFI